jgi:mediator of RNA polymerase II transcription subunit 31
MGDPLTPERERFLIELEFVQMLSNPSYLQFLAQNRTFESPEFIRYLNYLLYFTREPYTRYITFPYSLVILDLLQHKEFREQLKTFDTIQFIHTKQYRHWIAYLKEQKARFGVAMETAV